MAVVERGFFTGALQLDEFPGVGHGHVKVHLRRRVFHVAKVQHDLLIHNADTDAGDSFEQRIFLQLFFSDQLPRRKRKRHVAAGDGCGARAAVGLKHVAVDPHRTLAERLEVDNRA